MPVIDLEFISSFADKAKAMRRFPEMEQLERLADGYRRFGRVDILDHISFEDDRFPLYTCVLGSRDPQAPVFGLVGGVHGLEKIGTQVVLSYMEHLLERLVWDEGLRWQLERVKLILMPLVNPAGMFRNTRSNANDVDLMRNAPLYSQEGATPWVGGQRVSRLLPWFMGDPNRLEKESQALCDFIRKECARAPHSIIVDVHSGFGLVDQLWFPYARSRVPFPNLPEVAALKTLLDRVHAHHIYRFEPQAIHYTTHGDLWDYLYDEHREKSVEDSVFLPLTLELGSWNWVKKNPFQLFYRAGAFNPMKAHRQKRALRRHLPLFEFLMRTTISAGPWKVSDPLERGRWMKAGLESWYPESDATRLRDAKSRLNR